MLDKQEETNYYLKRGDRTMGKSNIAFHKRMSIVHLLITNITERMVQITGLSLHCPFVLTSNGTVCYQVSCKSVNRLKIARLILSRCFSSTKPSISHISSFTSSRHRKPDSEGLNCCSPVGKSR